MKDFKKTYKLICDECGAFMPDYIEYCENCGKKALRRAINEDYLKYEKENISENKETDKLQVENSTIDSWDKLRMQSGKFNKSMSSRTYIILVWGLLLLIGFVIIIWVFF